MRWRQVFEAGGSRDSYKAKRVSCLLELVAVKDRRERQRLEERDDRRRRSFYGMFGENAGRGGMRDKIIDKPGEGQGRTTIISKTTRGGEVGKGKSSARHF